MSLLIRHRKSSSRRTFTVSLESGDPGIFFRARIDYELTLLNSSGPGLQHPHATARAMIIDTIFETISISRLSSLAATEDAANRLLNDPLEIEGRLFISATVHISASRSMKRAHRRVLEEQRRTYLAHAKDRANLHQLELIIRDPILGPVWWLERSLNQQSASPSLDRIESLLDSYEKIRSTLESAARKSGNDAKDYARQKIDELFYILDDTETLDFLLRMIDTYIKSEDPSRKALSRLNSQAIIRDLGEVDD